MNDTIKTILERRSIRDYTTDPIHREHLDLIIQAGLYAPSSRNRQPWHLCVLQGQEMIDKLTIGLKAAIARMQDNPYAAQVSAERYTVNFHAPVFIIVSADPEVSTMPMADCALVLGNMFLAAHSLGIGSCWVNQLGSACQENSFRQILTKLGVPQNNYVYGCSAFGYAQSHPSAPKRKEGTVTFAETL